MAKKKFRWCSSENFVFGKQASGIRPTLIEELCSHSKVRIEPLTKSFKPSKFYKTGLREEKNVLSS